MRDYLYHVTNIENLESILKNGLVRHHDNKNHIAIYMSSNPMSWYQGGREIILCVHTEGLYDSWSSKSDSFMGVSPWSSFPEQDEFLFWGEIPNLRVGVYNPDVKEWIARYQEGWISKYRAYQKLLGVIKRFPIHPDCDAGSWVPYQIVEQHEKQCFKNHGQSCERLKERHGLSYRELYAVIHDIRYHDAPSEEMSKLFLKHLVIHDVKEG